MKGYSPTKINSNIELNSNISQSNLLELGAIQGKELCKCEDCKKKYCSNKKQ